MAELQERMPQSEFEAWRAFYRMYPFDDYHRFHRPAALVARSMGGGDVQPLLNWLQPDRGTAGMTDADMNTMRAFGYTKKGG